MGKPGYNTAGEWTTDDAVRNKPKQGFIKKGLLLIGGGLSAAWVGPVLPVCVAGTYVAGRYARWRLKNNDRDEYSLGFSLAELKAYLGILAGATFVIYGVGEYQQVRDKFFAPETVASKKVVVNAGKEILGGKDQVAICEPYFKPLPWLSEKMGSQGAKIGDVCVRASVTERQGLRATAKLSLNRNPPYLEAFRPEGGDTSGGYEKAIEVPLPR